jgi:hypothetical protein
LFLTGRMGTLSVVQKKISISRYSLVLCTRIKLYFLYKIYHIHSLHTCVDAVNCFPIQEIAFPIPLCCTLYKSCAKGRGKLIQLKYKLVGFGRAARIRLFKLTKAPNGALRAPTLSHCCFFLHPMSPGLEKTRLKKKTAQWFFLFFFVFFYIFAKKREF